MSMDQSNDIILVPDVLPFEALKRHNSQGVEYWSARDLQPCLGYTEYQILKDHFSEFFTVYCGIKLEPIANSEIVDGLYRFVSGIPSPFLNAVLGTPEGNSESNIKQQFVYFNKIKMPFIWYVDESSDSAFKNKLIEQGFQDIGIFRGVIGPLDKLIPDPEIPESCTIELVKTEVSMDEFAELVCTTFEINEESKNLYKKGLWTLANTEPPRMLHWLARKEGVVVSAISTFIEGPIVSFWNGASLPTVRRQGFSTAIRRVALQDAVSRGCRFGTSYLMSEGLALGICNQLGYETKWRFNAFLSPQFPSNH